jgi:hypothetical protein
LFADDVSGGQEKGRPKIMELGPGTQVAIVVADLAAWVLIMIVIGKWRAIIERCKALFISRGSANSDS